MKAFIGGAWREITSAKAYIGGAWRPITNAKSYIGSDWVTIANFTSGGGTITLALSPTSISAVGRNSTVTTANVTATPTGGQTPYTYAWVKQSGGDISATNPSNAITSFRGTGMAVDETRTAVFRCTCTDTFGTSDFEDITVSVTCLPPREEPDTGGTF